MKTTLTKYTILLITFLTVTLPVFAQGPPPATPIDGGLSLLLAAAGIYGIKKLRDSRK